MPATHQKENCDYIFDKFCEGLIIAGFENSANKSKSKNNALLLNPFHDNDEANFSLLENQETTPENKNAQGMVFFSRFAEKRPDNSRGRKSEDYNFEEMSFSSDIIDFWNQKPVNRNRKRVVDDFFYDANDNIFLSEVSTDPTTRHIRRVSESNNLCHSVGDLYNFLNPDLSTEVKLFENKSGEDLLELMQKKSYTSMNTNSSGEDRKKARQALSINKNDILKTNPISLNIDEDTRKQGDSPTEDSDKQKMDDGFMLSQNSESREIKEYTGLERVLIDSELGIESASIFTSEVKQLDITPDDEIEESLQFTDKRLETPKKQEFGTVKELNSSYTLGSAMKGKYS